MARRMSSGLIFMLAYTIFFILGTLIAWQIGVRVEAAYPDDPNLSLIVFLVLLGLVILIAGPLSLRVTPDDAPDQPPVR
jgi:hypothetical protein